MLESRETPLPEGGDMRGHAARVLRQVGLWVSVALIAAVGALSYFNIRDLIRLNHGVEHSLTVLREIELLAANLKDAESGQRGFLITGEESFLGAYRAAVQVVPDALSRLKSLIADKPYQTGRMAEIDELQRAIIETLTLNIEARRSRGVEGIDRVRLEANRGRMNRVRAITADMIAAETSLMRERTAAADRRATYSVAALGFGSAAGIAIIVVVFYFAQIEASRRRRAEAAARALAAELEQRVADRTHALAHEAEERREGEALLHAILEESPIAVIALDPKRHVVAWNRAAERIFGYAAAEVLGRPYPLVPPDGQAEFDEIIRRTASGERLQAFNVRRRHKSGVLVDVSFAGAPLYAGDGSLRAMVFLLEDTTGRGAAEARLRAVLDEAAFAVIAVDEQRRINVWNQAAERIFGFTAAEAIGRSWVDLLVMPEDRAGHERVWKRFPEGARIRNVPARRLKKDGTLVEVMVSGSGLFGADGTFRGAVGIMEDMTERRVLERQLRQAQRMEAVGQLTGGIAHDFNNILSVVIGNLDLLEDLLADRPKAQGLAQSALRGAARGAELVQRLLAFSRRQPLAPKAIDLGERLPGLASLLRRALGEHIAVETRAGDAVWPALTDVAMLEDAVLNLAINARDAMPNGGVLTIETANAGLDEAYAAVNADVKPGDYVMLAVSDTGTGMPREVVEKAFEPFFTTKEIGKGSGLGLSMVYGFVKQLGGHVKIYSEMGHGTSVKLYLPRAGADAEAAAETAGAAAPESLPRGTERVLLVEDNPGVREAAVQTLGQLGYDVHAEENGPAALAWLARGEPVDLLFTDIVMPEGMSGRELASQAVARRPGLKVLFTTGYAEAAMQNGHKLHSQALLIGKPYRKADLARMLRRALDGDADGGHKNGANGKAAGGETA